MEGEQVPKPGSYILAIRDNVLCMIYPSGSSLSSTDFTLFQWNCLYDVNSSGAMDFVSLIITVGFGNLVLLFIMTRP